MNKTKPSLWDRLSAYHVLGYTIFGIIVILFRDPISLAFINLMEIDPNGGLYNIIRYALQIALIVFWAAITIIGFRNNRYSILTEGRSYSTDHTQFNKTYGELVRFFTTNDPYKMNIDDLPIIDWKQAGGVILCKVKDRFGIYHLVRKKESENGNLLSIGLPGSGKSTTQAGTTAQRFNSKRRKGGCGVFAISIKGDLLNFVKGKRTNIKVFTPDKEEGSCHYDPLEGLDKMSLTEKRSFVENLSLIICPEEQGDNAAFFVNGARDYFCGITLYLIYLHENGKLEGRLRFPEIVEKILSGNVFAVTETIRDSGCKIAGEYTNSYEGSSEKNVSGIYNHLCKSVRPFNTGALKVLFDGEGDCISPDDLNTHDIYIDVPQDKYSIYAPAMAIITSNFLQAFMRRPDVSSNKKVVPILFLLDEAAQLHLDFNLLSQAMSTLRSKKVSIFLLMQSIAQLEGFYGEANSRQIIDLCAYISVFNAQDPKSREFFQKLVGNRKMLRASTSLSEPSGTANKTSGTSVTTEIEPIFQAADFGDLNTVDKSTRKKIYRVLVYANGKYILGETTPCYE